MRLNGAGGVRVKETVFLAFVLFRPEMWVSTGACVLYTRVCMYMYHTHTYTEVYTHASRTRTHAWECTCTFPPCVHMRCRPFTHMLTCCARSRTHAHAFIRRGMCTHSHTSTEVYAHSQVTHTHRRMHTRVANAGHTHTSGFSASSFLSADKMQSTLCLIKN